MKRIQMFQGSRCRRGNKIYKSFVLLALIVVLLGIDGEVVNAAVDINNVTVSAIKTDSVRITWDSTVPGTSQIEYGTTTSYGSVSPEDTLAYFHEHILTGLTAGYLYHFRIISKEWNGSTTVSSNYNFTTRTQAQLEAVIKAARTDGQLPKTYYVSNSTGSNSNNGTSPSSPWKTLTYASSKLDAGDTLYLMNDTWTDDPLASFARSGIDVAPIIVKAYPGAKPILKGFTSKWASETYDGISDNSRSFISLEDMEICYYFHGIRLKSSNNTINNVYVHDTNSHAVYLVTYGQSWNTLKNSMIYNAGTASTSDNGIQIVGNAGGTHSKSHHITVKNNTISHIYYHNTIDLYGSMEYVTIDGNDLSDGHDNLIANPHDAEIDHYEYLTIKNNKFHDHTQGNAAISLYATHNSLIYNNTFYIIKPRSTSAATWESNSNGIICLENKMYNSDALYALSGTVNYFIRNFVNTDAAPIGIAWDISATFLNNTGRMEISLGSGTNTATIQYDDNTVFVASGGTTVTPVQYTPTRSYTVKQASSTSITYSTYNMTVRPASGSATVTVNKFDTSLPKGNILVNFIANTTNGNNVIFNISTLKPNTNYLIKKDGTNFTTVKSDSTGKITFQNTVWSSAHTFTVEEGASAPDTTPPAAVTNLATSNSTTNSITLTWTAPGDDGYTGTASQYDIRYSTSSITESNWNSATQCTGEPAPKAAGSSETFTVTGLSPNTTYYFALKTADEVPNWSGISNSPSGTTLALPIGELMAYWNFDEETGSTVYDSSGIGNNGRLINNPLRVDGKRGKAICFDGIDDYIEIPSSASLNSITSQITILAWVKTDFAQRGTIVDNWYYDKTVTPQIGERAYVCSAETSADAGRFNFALSPQGDGSGVVWLTSNTAVTSGQWTHVAFVSNGATMSIYLNGNLDASTSAPAQIHVSNRSIHIGAWNAQDEGYPAFNNFFNGTIDEVKIYNRALSAAEIRADYEAGSEDTIPPATTYTITPGVVTFFRSDTGGSGISYTNYTKTSATGPWTTVTTIAATGQDAGNVSYITETKFNVSVSDQSTLWYYSVDKNSNKETIKNITVDTTPPSSISNLRNSSGISWINWSWTNPSNADFSHTMVFLNGTWKVNTSLWYYNATGLLPDTSYTISTRTVDTAGNINTSWVNQTSKTLMTTTNGTVRGTITYTNNGTGIADVIVNLTRNETIVASTQTDSDGNYIITSLAPGVYTLAASKIRFWSNSSSITVTAGVIVTVNRALWLKGDLNNNGIAVDDTDLEVMRNASIGFITPDSRYDLNANGVNADAGDYAMLQDAHRGKIVLV